MAARTIEVKITADTTELRRALMRMELKVARSWWRRMALRFAFWRLS